jgi:hypothetical protein
MIFFGTPPGTSSQSFAWCLHTACARLLARSRWRLDRIRHRRVVIGPGLADTGRA